MTTATKTKYSIRYGILLQNEETFLVLNKGMKILESASTLG
jgi:hypothetical protein